MRAYVEIDALRDVVLEESYVLGLRVIPGIVEISGDFVLGEHHEAFRPIPANESDCFVRGTLQFHGVRSVAWDDQGAPPATDASEELDYGHIDDLRWDGDTFELEGDWGRMRVVAAGLELALAE